MGASDLIVIHERLPQDDNTLVKMYFVACSEFRRRKSVFDKMRKNYDENNRLAFTLTKLKYEFAKEEYAAIHAETAKRGLIL